MTNYKAPPRGKQPKLKEPVNRKAVRFMRTIRERELLIHRGKKAFHGLNTMSKTKRAKCFALSAEGMIAQVLFVLEPQTFNLKQLRHTQGLTAISKIRCDLMPQGSLKLP